MRVVRVLAGLVAQLGNIVNEVLGRVTSLPGALAWLAGVPWTQTLRLRVVILRDEDGTPLLRDESQAQAAVDRARDILERECRIRLMAPAGEPMVITAPDAAPSEALDVHCMVGAWTDDLGSAGWYFRSLAARLPLGLPIGYGAPLTAFVVRSVAKSMACSAGPLTSYVTVSVAGMRKSPRALAHELGHSCGLPHRKETTNLMKTTVTGEHLSRWQSAVVRNSPHASLF